MPAWREAEASRIYLHANARSSSNVSAIAHTHSLRIQHSLDGTSEPKHPCLSGFQAVQADVKHTEELCLS